MKSPSFVYFNVHFNGMAFYPPSNGTALLVHTDSIEEVVLSRDENALVFLGATKGHLPLYLSCPHCDYVGVSNIRRVKGFAYYISGIGTVGLTFCLDLGKDTHHHCPSCNTEVGYAKLF
jgi:hypothetical protein